MKTGLIMEGGAMRGLFTAGITDVFAENNIEFDGAIGVSAGAAFGCNIKSRQPQRAARYNIKYCRDRRYYGLGSLIFTGDLFGADFCYHKIPEKLDIFDCDAFKKNPMEFYAVCTDIKTGNAVYKKCESADGDFIEWIRASASLPLVSRIVEVEGRKLLDGGISDSVPLKYFENIGYTNNVVILTRPKGYRKEQNKMMPLIRHALNDYPNMVNAIENRHNMYNAEMDYIEEKERRGEVLVLRPKNTLPVNRTSRNRKKLIETYNAGRNVGKENIDKIKGFLTK